MSETNPFVEYDDIAVSSTSAPLLKLRNEDVLTPVSESEADEVASFTAEDRDVRIQSAMSIDSHVERPTVKQYSPEFLFHDGKGHIMSSNIKLNRPPPGMSPRRGQRPIHAERQELAEAFHQNQDQLSEEGYPKIEGIMDRLKPLTSSRRHWRHDIVSPFEPYAFQGTPLGTAEYPFMVLPDKQNFQSKAKRTILDWSGPPKQKGINWFQQRLGYLGRLLVGLKRRIERFPLDMDEKMIKYAAKATYMQEVIEEFRNLPTEETTANQLKKAVGKLEKLISKAIAMATVPPVM
jgi:hypothetical protein